MDVNGISQGAKLGLDLKCIDPLTWKESSSTQPQAAFWGRKQVCNNCHGQYQLRSDIAAIEYPLTNQNHIFKN